MQQQGNLYGDQLAAFERLFGGSVGQVMPSVAGGMNTGFYLDADSPYPD